MVKSCDGSTTKMDERKGVTVPDLLNVKNFPVVLFDIMNGVHVTSQHYIIELTLGFSY